MPIAKLTRQHHPVQYKYFKDLSSLKEYTEGNKFILDVEVVTTGETNFAGTLEEDKANMMKIAYGSEYTYSDMKMAERIYEKLKMGVILNAGEVQFRNEWRKVL